MDWNLAGLFVLVGVFVGLVAGFFGIGGGLIAIPVFLWIFKSKGIGGDYYVHVAFGTNLFIIIFTSLLASYRHSKNNQVLWHAVPVIVVFSVLAAYSGAAIAHLFSGEILTCLFSVLLIYSGLRLLKMKTHHEDIHRMEIRHKKLLYGLTGMITGLISGISGLGGGIVTIPFMISVLKFPVKMVAGTSSSIMVFTAMAATLGYIINGWQQAGLPPGSLGYVYLYAAIPTIFGSAIFAQVGAQINHIISTDKLQVYFAIFLLFIAAKMLFFK
jgi:uncharacterized membrane protein YfcA